MAGSGTKFQPFRIQPRRIHISTVVQNESQKVLAEFGKLEKVFLHPTLCAFRSLHVLLHFRRQRAAEQSARVPGQLALHHFADVLQSEPSGSADARDLFDQLHRREESAKVLPERV